MSEAERQAQKGAGEGEEEGTGLPGLRSWGAVYALVLVVFVVWVVVLTVFTRVFS
jgi:hypothetical protein